MILIKFKFEKDHKNVKIRNLFKIKVIYNIFENDNLYTNPIANYFNYHQ